MAEIILTEQNFEQEVLKSEIPVLVDFWAEWCAPCRMLAPAIAAIAAEREGSLKVGKLNVDQAPMLAAQYGIVSIPTVMVFKGGEAVQKTIGLQPKEQLEQLLD
ncbi:MAG: thioredoxin [Clostridia bacterium]|nr:thioredoxin [Clostridia bacterium]